ncbi:hypothetical protein [Pseudoalteromonas sp. Of7M-16]|uniref:hypothetical protein n=1 Tax=Pseudoalteromonas sp. Of7M-16 TaxID=2917756 RepID=UPI001EF4D4CA|nr:hypothetical protein [Pseudoalteromonas sp. Of7M-16]MCG7548571.1 hypothetical protein [Pseudoalteromonas sp. Of7M-16]
MTKSGFVFISLLMFILVCASTGAVQVLSSVLLGVSLSCLFVIVFLEPLQKKLHEEKWKETQKSMVSNVITLIEELMDEVLMQIDPSKISPKYLGSGETILKHQQLVIDLKSQDSNCNELNDSVSVLTRSEPFSFLQAELRAFYIPRLVSLFPYDQTLIDSLIELEADLVDLKRNVLWHDRVTTGGAVRSLITLCDSLIAIRQQLNFYKLK